MAEVIADLLADQPGEMADAELLAGADVDELIFAALPVGGRG